MKFFSQDTSRISEKDLADIVPVLSGYREDLQRIIEEGGYDAPECSINVPSDEEMHEVSRLLAYEKRTPGLKYIVVVGIGGSNLGTQAVYEAIRGEVVQAQPRPQMLFADTSDPRKMTALLRVLEDVHTPDEVIVNMISKSGSTTETVANFAVLLDMLSGAIGNIDDRVVMTTDEGSALWNFAFERGLAVLPIPKNVGGRYSVFTPVGVFPLALADIDTAKLLAGAREMRERCLSGDLGENPALAGAGIMFAEYQNGVRIHDHFFFETRLESLGKWCRQLMAESLGKERDQYGEIVHAGITPTVSIGSTDLHSMVQLYLGGPKGTFTSFVSVKEALDEPVVPKEGIATLVPGIAGRTLTQIMGAILVGTKKAYQNRELPFVEIVLEQIDEREIGAFLQYKMIETMYLAHVLKVNAFDQPNVEEYKEETRKVLENT